MPKLRTEEIEHRANRTLVLCNEKGIKPNLKKIALKLGIEVNDNSHPKDDSISGILIKTDSPKILINSKHSPQRQRFTLAHEIGHFILHNEDLFIDKKTPHFFRAKGINNWMETEANIFAAALLMPKELIREELKNFTGKSSSDQVIKHLAETFNVSNQAMGIRLINLGYELYSA